ncbi:tetratricopeptide repeat protein [Wolbachia endosymbiont of Tribolium confusum]|uniref:FxSxx-COOH system tetratricopeptide repeat protein n=1 Tax=Wolbachia endosymbiont of Tribolium confusum TaxID=214474 RepID=UPI001CF38D73|nr:FxSxx-COOH system tetratricopeptide repeat protein [Wolbachia endosymbiont of Tribolium confusum]MCA7010368.1 tetratricopeptide repeat protein [Wolbachia endosymbiont of Tribolium confusum]
MNELGDYIDRNFNELLSYIESNQNEVKKVFSELIKQHRQASEEIANSIAEGREENKEGFKQVGQKLDEIHSTIVAGQENRQVKEPIWFDVKRPVSLFTGRKEELIDLHNKIQRNSGKVTVISQITSISGLGGIGKTELARRYIQEYSNDYYNNVIWINAESEVTLIESFTRLAKDKLRIDTKDTNGEEKDIQAIVEEVYEFFSNSKSLFIFDDAEKSNYLNKFLPLHDLLPGGNRPYILITSRNREWERGIEVINLNELKSEEAIEFVKKGLSIEDESQNEKIKALVEKLQHFPLAMQQAIAYIEDQRVTREFDINDYLNEYEKKTKDLLNYEAFKGIDNDYAKTTFTTWKITTDKIASDRENGKLALRILNIISYLAPDKISREVFLGLTGIGEEELRSAVRLLIKYSVVNGEQKQSVLSTHKLAQEVTRIELEEEGKSEEVMKETFELLRVSFPYGSDKLEDYVKRRQLLPHLEAFLSYIDNWLKKNPEDKQKMEEDYLEDLLIRMNGGYFNLGNPQRQKELLERALPILESRYGKGHFEVARALVNLSISYGALGDAQGAKELLERALPILENHYGEDHFEVAIALVNLSVTYGVLGNYQKTKKLLEKALPILKKHYGEDHFEVAKILVNLGVTYGALGDHQKVKELIKKALPIIEDRYGEDHFEVAKTLVNLGITYGVLGDHQEVKKLLEKALPIIENHYGEDHFEVARALINLSVSYGALGDHQKAKELLERILPILENHYGEDHFEVAKTIISLSISYGALDDYHKQAELLERALPILENHYGEDHFEVAKTLVNLGVTYGALGDYQEAKEVLEKALPIVENHYGEDHFEVARALVSLSISCGALDDYHKQAEFLERALPILENYYGANHFEVGITLKNLGIACLALGDAQEAKEVLEKALPIIENHYGEDLFKVAEVLMNLSISYGALNDYRKQKELLERALPILEKHHGEDHFEVAIALENLASADKALGNDRKAEKLLERAAKIYQRGKTLVEECLPSTSSGRSKREAKIGECELSWEDVDKFNTEKDEKRDFSKIKIDSEKFVNYIKDLPERKHFQLIELADKVEVTGRFRDLVNKLTSNQKVMNHLNRVKKISSIAMHGMMAKNVLADFLNGDYEGVAINVGFIAGGQGFAKVAEVASRKGLNLLSEGKILLGRSLKVASPLLAQGTSAFIIYDLVNQIKAFKNGTKEALVGIVEDSIYLGVDAAEIGIEVAEAFEVLEGVSSITGPIGAGVGAVVFVGTDVYMAVKRVDKIDQLIHLSEREKFIEGLRAFIGMQPEQYIEELMEEKQLYNQLVKQGFEYLKEHSDIQSYVFPTGKSVVDFCHKVLYPALSGMTPRYYTEKCTTKFEIDLDSTVLLDRKRTNIKWSRARPDDPSGGKLLCLPQENDEPAPSYGSYLCENAIGLSNNKTEGYTLINLGEGEDYARGFKNSPNMFVVNDGFKRYYGGNKNDIFIFQEGLTEGYLHGEGGIDTLDLTEFAQEVVVISVYLNTSIGYVVYNHHGYHRFKINSLERVLGRKAKADRIFSACETKFVDGNGGEEDQLDYVKIENNNCYYDIQVIVRNYTEVDNMALKGNFSYIVPFQKGSASVKLLTNLESNHRFIFDYLLPDIQSVDIEGQNSIRFDFFPKVANGNFNVTILYNIINNITYQLKDGTEIKVSKERNLYAIQSANTTIDKIIESYPAIANKLNMTIAVQSDNESILVGHGKCEVLRNNPIHNSHLIGNGGENIYVITIASGEQRYEHSVFSIPQVNIYNLDRASSIDTLDLRNVVKIIQDDLKVHISLPRIYQDGNDLLVKLEAENMEQNFSAVEVLTVRLKDGLDWYQKLHIISDNALMKISSELELKPLPLIFGKDKEIIVVTVQDVEEGTELITPRKGGNYTFVRNNFRDLIITNAFDSTITRDDLCSITLNKFYKIPKMKTLSIKFADKEIMLKDHQKEISTARDINIVKREYNEQLYNDVFNRSEQVMLSDQPHRHRRHIRNRRSEYTMSSGTRSSSWINGLFGWVKSSIGGLLSFKPEQTSSTPSPISQVDAKMDVNGTIMLLDVLVRKVTGQKYISTGDRSISPLEAQEYTLNITKGFEKVVEQAGLKSGVSMHRLNIDYMGMQKEITRKVMSGKFNEISGILKSYVGKACPGEEAGKLSTKKFDKFIAQFDKGLLNQSIEQILHNRDGRLEVDDTKQMSLEPQSYLSNASVQSHPKASTCLSEIGVTKLGGNINR